jgi:multidrug efflux pump subunit AcrB
MLRRALSCRIAALAALTGVAAAPAAEKEGGAAAGPTVQVVTCYQGMTADDVEKTITNRIERWVNQAPGLRRIDSHTIAGVSIVRAYFDKDTTSTAALTTTNSLAQAALPNLPPNTLPPVVFPLGPENTRPLGLLAVEGPNLSEAQLKDVARTDVRSRLLLIPGCVAPAVLGGRDRAVIIYLDPKKLAARKLSPAEVAEALRKANTKIELGTAYLGDNQVRLEAGAAVKDVAELENLPLRGKPGEEVLLRDVGRVEDGYAVATARVRIDGRRGVIVPVYWQAGAAPAAVREGVAKALPALERALPRGAHLRWVPFGGKAGAEDTGLITLLIRAPSNLRLDAAEKRVAAVEQFLRVNVPARERTAIISELGVAQGLEAIYTRNDGQQDSTIYLRLAEGRRQTARQYVEKLRRLFREDAKLADLSVRFEADGRAAPLAVVVRGGKGEEAARLAAAVQRRVASVRGAAEVTVLERTDAPLLTVEVDRRKAAAVGLSVRDLLTQATAALGSPLPFPKNFWLDSPTDNRLILAVPYPEGAKLDDVLSAPALGANTPVRLSALLSLRRSVTPVEIDHIDLHRVFRVAADVEGRAVRDVAADITKALKELRVPVPVQVEVEIQGQRQAP